MYPYRLHAACMHVKKTLQYVDMHNTICTFEVIGNELLKHTTYMYKRASSYIHSLIYITLCAILLCVFITSNIMQKNEIEMTMNIISITR